MEITPQVFAVHGSMVVTQLVQARIAAAHKVMR